MNAHTPTLTAADICDLRLRPDVATTNYGVCISDALGHWREAREARHLYWQARDHGHCDYAQRYKARATYHFKSAVEQLALARFYRGFRNA